MFRARRNALILANQVAETPDYLCFTAEQANSVVRMQVTGTPSNPFSLETSTDRQTWTPFVVGTTNITLANIGDRVYFRGDNIAVSESTGACRKFSLLGKISASGNIMSLLDKTCKQTSLTNYTFYNLFNSNPALTTAPQLPATTLAEGCYHSMFLGCESLTTAPQLPATTLAGLCYYNMFYRCKSLTTAPQLPATTLVGSCYFGMFMYCTSLTTAPQLPATTLASRCYISMFVGCSSLKVYSSSGAGHDKAWRIPASGQASQYTSQTSMFKGCPGDYAEAASVTLNQTFYTQNEPV